VPLLTIERALEPPLLGVEVGVGFDVVIGGGFPLEGIVVVAEDGGTPPGGLVGSLLGDAPAGLSSTVITHQLFSSHPLIISNIKNFPVL
jgi:hypothetical protein